MQAQFLKITGKYEFIFMGNRRWVWDNKSAHNSQETAHSAILLHDRNWPGGTLALSAATVASLGEIKGFVKIAYMRKCPVAGAVDFSVFGDRTDFKVFCNGGKGMIVIAGSRFCIKFIPQIHPFCLLQCPFADSE